MFNEIVLDHNSKNIKTASDQKRTSVKLTRVAFWSAKRLYCARWQNQQISDQPHNPMVNSGAIMSASILLYLLKPYMNMAQKYDYVYDFFKVRKFFWDSKTISRTKTFWADWVSHTLKFERLSRPPENQTKLVRTGFLWHGGSGILVTSSHSSETCLKVERYVAK